MRTLARAATSSLVALGVVLALVVVAVAAIGILGIRSAVQQGTVIAGGELTTAVQTGQLSRNMDAAYATGEAAFAAADPATRSRLLGSLDADLLPAIDGQLYALEQLHTGDPAAEYADLELFARQWTAVRDLLSQPNLTAQPTRPAAASAAGLTAAYQPVSAHLNRLILKELYDGHTDHAVASASADRVIGLSLGVAAGGIVVGALLLRLGFRRIRRNLEPGQAHNERGGRPPLLSCPVCARVPGASSCVPLIVGGDRLGRRRSRSSRARPAPAGRERFQPRVRVTRARSVTRVSMPFADPRGGLLTMKR